MREYRDTAFQYKFINRKITQDTKHDFHIRFSWKENKKNLDGWHQHTQWRNSVTEKLLSCSSKWIFIKSVRIEQERVPHTATLFEGYWCGKLPKKKKKKLGVLCSSINIDLFPVYTSGNILIAFYDVPGLAGCMHIMYKGKVFGYITQF